MLTAVAEVDRPAEQPSGKGRPTPKRRDARKQRRTAVPANRKEAAKIRREKLREQRTLQRQALLTGDERHLPARDAGPAKRLARDVVDSRFTVGQVFFGLILVILVASIGISPRKYPTVGAAINVLAFVSLFLVALDAFRIGRKAKQLVAAAYGDKAAIGVTAYAAIRAMQPRRLRRPPPRVKRGDAPTSSRT